MSLCSQWTTENFKGQLADLEKEETTAHHDVLDQKIDAWMANPERSEQKSLARVVRKGIGCQERLKLWLAISGGQNRLYSCPEFYSEVQKEYGKFLFYLYSSEFNQYIQTTQISNDSQEYVKLQL